jgi:hypothetical protein
MTKPGHLTRHLFGLIIGIIALSSVPTHAQGIITTVAGNGSPGFSGDGGPATSSTLNLGEFTGGVAVDTSGNLFIADSNNNRVRKVDLSGTITTVATSLNYPSGLAVDTAGNLYIVDTGNQRIRKLSPNGTITTVVGNGVAGFSGDGGPAISASLRFNRYTGNCAVDSAGNLYIPDTENYRVRRVGTDGIITTVASVRWPYSVAVDAGGDIYIGAEDGVFGKVQNGGFNVPAGVAVDSAGNLYIADSHSHRIRKVEPNGSVSVVAGSGDPIFDPIEGYYFVGGFSGDGGPATTAQLNFPWGVAVDPAGNINIADSLNNRIRKVIAVTNDDQGTFTSPDRIVLFGPDASAPYPSALSVSGLTGKISEVTVTIRGLDAPNTADLAFLLVGPGGQSSILMSGVPMNDIAQTITVTFADAAPSMVTNFASGTYKPSPLKPVSLLPSAPSEPYGQTLSVFNGTSPNGEWKLYAVNFNSDLACAILGENCAVVGGWSLTVTTTPPTPNAIDDVQFFVRQQYLDFLNREPDPLSAEWVRSINGCASDDPACDRIHVSEAFFKSDEFGNRGYFVWRFYPISFANVPGVDPPGAGHKPEFQEFIPDLQNVSGFLTVAELEAAKEQFAINFTQRPAFVALYGSLNNADFVNTLCNTAGVTLANQQALIDSLSNGATRAQVLRQIAESPEVFNKYYSEAFVVMQYFGYLRRNPDALYFEWIKVLDANPSDSRHMIEGFVNSIEYRHRFGP